MESHPQTPISETTQPADSDLEAIAQLSTTAFGRALLALADAGALRTVAQLGAVSPNATGVLVQNTTAADVPLVLKGAVSQTGDLQQWQDSTGTALARIGSNGSARVPFVEGTNAGSNPYVQMSTNSVMVYNRTAASNIPLVVKGMAGQTGNLQQWQDSTGAAVAKVDAAGGLYVPYLNHPSNSGPYILPSTTALSVVNRTTVSNVPLVVQGMASQTGSLQQWQNSAATVLASVDSSGGFNAPSYSRDGGTGPYLNMTSGAVQVLNRTGTSNIPLVVKGMASQSGDLQQWQDSAGTVLMSVSSGGSLSAPNAVATPSIQHTTFTGPEMVPSAASITIRNRDNVGNVPLTVKGMASQTGNLQEWQDSAGAVTAFVSSVGGVAATGGIIAPYMVNASNTETYIALTGGSVLLQNRNTVTNKPLIVQGMAAQTGNLQEWQNDSATVLARVSPNGTISASGSGVLTPYVQTPGGGGVFLGMDGSTVRVENATTASNVALTVKGMASQSGDLTQWKNSGGSSVAKVYASGEIVSTVAFSGPLLQNTSATGPYVNVNANDITVLNRTTASNVPLIVKGMASQSGDLTQWQDSTGAAVAQITANGTLSAATAVVPYVLSGGTNPYVQLAASVFVVNRTTVSNVPLVVKGMAAQSGSLQQWQDSTGAAQAWVSASGGIFSISGYVGPSFASNGVGTDPYIAMNATNVSVINRTTASNVPLVVKGMAAQTGALQEWQDSSGTSVGSIWADGSTRLPALQANGAGSYPYLSITSSGFLLINRNNTANVPLIIKGMAGQTGNLLEVQASDTAALASITSGGSVNAVGNVRVGTFGLGTGGSKVIEIANASVIPSANPTGGGVLYVEAGALKYRGSSGTITTIAPA